MKKRSLLFSILALVFGAFLIVYGGIDDSPGGQVLGFLVFIVGVAGAVKSKKKVPDSH